MRGKDISDTIIIAAGGTSGHIYPALAIAAAVRDTLPDVSILFSGVANSLEEKMVKEEDYPFCPVPAQNLPSRQDRRFFSWISRNTKGYFAARRLLKEKRPRLVIGTGGFVSAPLIAAAGMMGIPYILHEQNSIPGRANRLFSKKAHTVFISYESSRPLFRRQDHLVFSGNPVRPLFYELDREEVREELGVPKEAFLVLIMGGSLGARTLNNAISDLAGLPAWTELLQAHPEIRLVISTGVQSAAGSAEALAGVPGVLRAESFLHDAPGWIAACDLFVGRAGAMTCAEIAARGRPSILIPFPYAADDHQTFNARAMEEAGAALVFQDRDFNSQVLCGSLARMVNQPDELALMGDRARHWATPDAADKIARLVAGIMKSNEPESP